jgi:DNA-binding beta-propeller fold protein YncE
LGNGEFAYPKAVAVAPNGNVYVSEADVNHRIQYFTPTGSYLGQWGSYGDGNGRFDMPIGIAVAPSRNVYVADTSHNRIQYFTPTGKYLGFWGEGGEGPREFNLPHDISFSSSGTRIYIVDCGNHQIKYYRDTAYAVAPTSLGRVKALFK